MMGQQTMESVAALRRIVMVVAVAALMGLMMAVSAASAFAAPKHVFDDANDDSAAGKCKPPGLSFSNPELPTEGPNGLKVKENCVPSH